MFFEIFFSPLEALNESNEQSRKSFCIEWNFFMEEKFLYETFCNYKLEFFFVLLSWNLISLFIYKNTCSKLLIPWIKERLSYSNSFKQNIVLCKPQTSLVQTLTVKIFSTVSNSISSLSFCFRIDLLSFSCTAFIAQWNLLCTPIVFPEYKRGMSHFFPSLETTLKDTWCCVI